MEQISRITFLAAWDVARTCLLPALSIEWQSLENGCEPRPSSFSYHNSPQRPLWSLRGLERLVSFDWNQVSSQRQSTDRNWTDDDHFWSARSQIGVDILIIEPSSSSFITSPPPCLFHPNGWSVRITTRRSRRWPEDPVNRTLWSRYAALYIYFCQKNNGWKPLSSHHRYFDAIWLYRSHSSTGETFHV